MTSVIVLSDYASDAIAFAPSACITREELQEQIWGNTFVDFDQSLNKAVNRVQEYKKH
jgi:DNA-binding response OmpR family regulator